MKALKCWSLILGLSAFRIEREWISVLCKLPSLWCSVVAAQSELRHFYCFEIFVTDNGQHLSASDLL
jgi:hypothetical protein